MLADPVATVPSEASAAAQGSPTPDSPGALTNPEIMALEQQLGVLFAAGRSLMRDRAVAVHPELSPGGYSVLASLVRCGPQHASAIASSLLVDKSVISRVVRQLTDLGLVERRADPSDGRAFFIAATPSAEQRVHAIRDSYRSALHRFLEGWDPSDIRQLTSLLARLNSAAPQ